MNQFFQPPRLLEESKPYFLGANSGMLTQRGAATLSGMLNNCGVEQTSMGGLGFTLPSISQIQTIAWALRILGYATGGRRTLASYVKWAHDNGFTTTNDDAFNALVAQARAYVASSAFQQPSKRWGLRGLGDWATDLVSSISTASSDALSTITGAKAQQTAQQNAILLAQQQAQAQVAQSQLRTAGWVSAAPWVAIGVVGVVGTLVYALMKKR